MKAKTKNDFAYIKRGEDLNCHKTFLNSHRKPWYKIEGKEPAPIMVAVFNRSRLKVVRNELLIYALTAFHGIYMEDRGGRDYTNILFCYLLTTIGQSILFESKREYGDGLGKFEPGDLNAARILDFDCLSDEDYSQIELIYQALTDENLEEKKVKLQEIFMQYL